MSKTISAYEAVASEEAVIGAVMNGFVDIADIDLRPDDFQNMVCRTVFEAMTVLSAQNKPCDLVTVADNCRIDAGTLAGICTQGAISDVLVPNYVQNIREATLRRAMREAALEVTRSSADAGTNILDSMDSMRLKLDDIMHGVPASEVFRPAEMVSAFYRWLEEDDDGKVIRSNMRAFDSLLSGGIRGSKLVVFGARPSVGKSALGLHMALNAANDGRRVLIVSLEMDEQEISQRALARYSGIDLNKFESKEFTPDEFVKLAEATGRYAQLPLMIATQAHTPGQVRRLANKLKHTEGLDLIIVDYLQLLEPDDKTSSRTEAVSSISRQLKQLAMALKTPIIAMTQFNRESERDREEGRMPKMSESRESGSIEQDANVFVTVHRPSRESLSDDVYKVRYDMCREHGWDYLQLIVAKNRNGKKGILDVWFDGAHMRFGEFEND